MSRRKSPKGRDEVMASVIEVAAELFAKHGVAAVSLREIAARAKVNYGLIYRHFGSKENLRLKVQDHLAAQIKTEIGNPESPLEVIWSTLAAIRRHEAFWRVLARTFLDGELQGPVLSEFPLAREMVELARRTQQAGAIDSTVDPRMIVAGVAAMGLGLMVFEKFILAGTGLDDEDGQERINQIVLAWIQLAMKQQ